LPSNRFRRSIGDAARRPEVLEQLSDGHLELAIASYRRPERVDELYETQGDTGVGANAYLASVLSFMGLETESLSHSDRSLELAELVDRPLTRASTWFMRAILHLGRGETMEFAERAVTTLSGGERARVALARALATQAPVLLADEPTAALDPRHQLTVMELLRTAARGGNAILAIMHDLSLAARFADRILVMDQGALVADGPPAQALAPERLAAVFGIEAQFAEVAGKRVPLASRAL